MANELVRPGPIMTRVGIAEPPEDRPDLQAAVVITVEHTYGSFTYFLTADEADNFVSHIKEKADKIRGATIERPKLLIVPPGTHVD